MKSLSIASRTLTLGGGQFFARVIALVWVAWMARQLGPYDFGWYTAAISLATVVISIAPMGVNYVALRGASQDLAKGPALYGTYFWVRVLSGLACWGLLMGAPSVLGYPDFMHWVIGLLGLYLLFLSVTQVAEAVYIAEGKTRYLWLTQVAANLLWAATGLIVLLNGKGLIWLFGALAFTHVGMALVHVGLLRHLKRWPDLSWQPARMKEAIRLGLPLGMVSIFAVAYERLDRIMLSASCTPQEVGAYGMAAMVLFGLLEALWQPLTTVLFPFLSRAAVDENQDHFRHLLRKAVFWSTLLAIPMVILIAIGAPWIIHLIGGASYERAARLLKWLIIALPFMALNRIFGNVLIAHEQYHAYLKLQVLAFALSLCANLWLLPRYEAFGAALVVIGTQALLTLGYLKLIAQRHRLFYGH